MEMHHTLPACMRTLYRALVTCTMLLIMALTLHADEEKPESIPPTPAKQKATVNFYMQGGYEINTNNPPTGLNDFRYFDQRADFISPDLFEIKVNQEPGGGTLGYRIKVTGGKIAGLIHARGLGNPDQDFDATEFFLAYTIPVGKGLKVEGGKMNTHIGAETLEAIYDQNYTRAFCFTYAQPTTHTGLRLTYPLSSQVSLQGHVYNGWDTFSEYNAAKTLGLSLCYNPNDNVGVYFNVLSGPEPDNNTFDSEITNNYYNNRFLFDWVGSFRLSKKLLLLANYDHGVQQNYQLTGSNATWEGFSLIGSYDFTDRFSLALRGEFLSDPQGYRTGFPQTLREITLSPQFKIGKNTVVRPEYRYDWSDANSFNGGTTNHQSTIGVGVMVLFGTK
jgi:hypothetical protein